MIQWNTKKTENCLPLLIVPTSGSLGEFRMIFPQDPQENTTGVLQAGILQEKGAILLADTLHQKDAILLADTLQKGAILLADTLQKGAILLADILQKGAILLADTLQEKDAILLADTLQEKDAILLAGFQLPEIMPRIQRVSPEEFPVPGRLSTMMSGLQVVFGCFLD
jgi:hypothetical protein